MMSDGRWIAALRYAATAGFCLALVAVVFLSVTPRPIPTSGPLLSDKVQHLAAYAVLAIAGGVGLAAGTLVRRMAVGLFALGLAMEGVQAFVPGRFAGFDDVVANTLGIAIGSGIALVINRSLARAASGGI